MDRQQFKVLTYDLIKHKPNLISDEVSKFLNQVEKDGYDIVSVNSTAIAGTNYADIEGVMPQLVVTIHFTKRVNSIP